MWRGISNDFESSGLENPTVAILEQLANALDAKIVEFFVVPAPDEPPPKPLRGGRRPKR